VETRCLLVGGWDCFPKILRTDLFFFFLVQSLVFDIVGDSVNRSFEQPFAATSADLNGPMLCLGVSGGVQVARLDWAAHESASVNWQPLSLDSNAATAGSRKSMDALACAPGDKGVAAAENHSLHFWDYARPQPVFSAAAWGLGVRSLCAAIDASGQQCVVGSARGGMLNIDFRQKSKVTGY